MDICQTCGLPTRRDVIEADELLQTLREAGEARYVYRTADDRWFLTSRGDDLRQVDASAVQTLALRGEIRPVYRTCPQDAYFCGETR